MGTCTGWNWAYHNQNRKTLGMEFAKRSSTGHVKTLGFDCLLDSVYNNVFHHFITAAWKASCVCKSRSVQMERTLVGAMPNLQTELGIAFSTAQLRGFTYT